MLTIKMMSFLIALTSCWVLGGATDNSKGQMYTNRFLNMTFTNNIVLEATAQTQRECALQCNQEDSCVTFTFHENTCTGHDVYMSTCSASTPVTGARSFARQSDELCGMTGVKRLTDASLGLDTDVYCDGDWLVFQRRQDGIVDFYRNWTEYTNGFGDVHGEYWLGLENLHRITTSSGSYELRVEVTSFDGAIGTASYSNFYVGPAADNYTLHYECFLGGNAGDSLNHHRGRQFSTFDVDNDQHSSNCAAIYRGAWWYGTCHSCNLNGEYKPTEVIDSKGIIWKTYTSNAYYTLKSCQMMVRPV